MGRSCSSTQNCPFQPWKTFHKPQVSWHSESEVRFVRSSRGRYGLKLVFANPVCIHNSLSRVVRTILNQESKYTQNPGSYMVSRVDMDICALRYRLRPVSVSHYLNCTYTRANIRLPNSTPNDPVGAGKQPIWLNVLRKTWMYGQISPGY